MGKKESSGFQSFLGFELRAGGLCSAELGELWAQGVDWQQKIGWLWNKCSASSPAKAPLCVCWVRVLWRPHRHKVSSCSQLALPDFFLFTDQCFHPRIQSHNLKQTRPLAPLCFVVIVSETLNPFKLAH